MVGFNPAKSKLKVEEGKIIPERAKPKKRFHAGGILEAPPEKYTPTKRPRSTAEQEACATGVEESFANDLIESGAYWDFDDSFDVEGFYSGL